MLIAQVNYRRWRRRESALLAYFGHVAIEKGVPAKDTVPDDLDGAKHADGLAKGCTGYMTSRSDSPWHLARRSALIP